MGISPAALLLLRAPAGLCRAPAPAAAAMVHVCCSLRQPSSCDSSMFTQSSMPSSAASAQPAWDCAGMRPAGLCPAWCCAGMCPAECPAWCCAGMRPAGGSVNLRWGLPLCWLCWGLMWSILEEPAAGSRPKESVWKVASSPSPSPHILSCCCCWGASRAVLARWVPCSLEPCACDCCCCFGPEPCSSSLSAASRTVLSLARSILSW